MSWPTQIINLPPVPQKRRRPLILRSNLVPRALYYLSGRRENLGKRMLESLNDGDDNENVAKAVGLKKTLPMQQIF